MGLTLEDLIELAKGWPHKDILFVAVIDEKEYVVTNANATRTKLYLRLEAKNDEGRWVKMV